MKVHMMNLSHNLLISIICLLGLPSTIQGQPQRCDYTIAPSEAGLGIFALRDLHPWNLFEVSVGIPIPMPTIYWTELVNYVEGYNSTHCLLTLGNGLLMNHHHNTRNYVNTWKAMSPHPSVLSFRPPYQSSIDLLYEYTTDITAGQQLFVDYGFDWFEQRSLQYSQLPEFYAQQDFKRVFPQLDTNLISSSPVLMDNGKKDWKSLRDVRKVTEALGWPVCNYQYSTYRGGELVASIDIPVDTIVEVSRALLIPITRSLLLSGPLEEVLWWVLDVDQTDSKRTEEVLHQIGNETIRRPSNPYKVEAFDLSGRSKYAILLTGRGPFYSLRGFSPESDIQQQEDSNYEAHSGNVQMEFYTLGDGTPYASVSAENGSLQCHSQMLVTIKAKRMIAAGEKLTLDYIVNKDNSRRFISEDLIRQCYSTEHIKESISSSEEL